MCGIRAPIMLERVRKLPRMIKRRAGLSEWNLEYALDCSAIMRTRSRESRSESVNDLSG